MDGFVSSFGVGRLLVVAGPLLAGILVLAATGMLQASAPATDPPVADRGGRVILITGSTDGLGREVARRLATGGAHVIVHGRNVERGEALVREIAAEGRGVARFYPADFATIDGVRDFAETLLRDYDGIDVVVNNAGIWINSPDRPAPTADGLEIHFAVNYLSGYLITRMLMPQLRERAGRVINVASAAQTPIDFDDVMLEHNYSAGRAYGQSKLAQIISTMAFAREMEGSGVTFTALHPATLMNTTMVAEAGMQPRSTIEEGADAVMNLINGENIPSGQYYNGLQPATANAQAYDQAAQARLRRLSDELVGLR